MMVVDDDTLCTCLTRREVEGRKEENIIGYK